MRLTILLAAAVALAACSPLERRCVRDIVLTEMGAPPASICGVTTPRR